MLLKGVLSLFCWFVSYWICVQVLVFISIIYIIYRFSSSIEPSKFGSQTRNSNLKKVTYSDSVRAEGGPKANTIYRVILDVC